MNKRYSLWFYWSLYIFIVLIDGITKLLALRFCEQEIVITPFFSCELAYNRGISWSMFHSESPVVFGIVTLAIIAIMTWLVIHTYKRWHEGGGIGAETLVLGGATGNLINRFVNNGVIDFLMFHYHDWVWPLFNIADVAIVCGAIYMIFESIKES